MSGFQKARGGGGRGGGRGGGHGGGRGGSASGLGDNTGDVLPDFSTLSLDQMASPVRPPPRKPVSGSLVDPSPFPKLLTDIASHASIAEYPLRKAIHATNCVVYTNHFALKLDPELPLYQYHITGLPSRMGKKTAKVLVKELIQANTFLRTHQRDFVTDYFGTLISWIKIPEEGLRSFAVTSRPDRESVHLELWYKEIVNVHLLRQYADGEAQPTEDTRRALSIVQRALDLAISKSLEYTGSLSLKGNKFYVTGGHAPLGHSLCTMRGYHFAVKPRMAQILLTVDTSTSAFFQPIPVDKFLMDTDTFKTKAERLAMLQGLNVQLTYNPKHSGNESESSPAAAPPIKTIVSAGLPCDKQPFTLRGVGGAANREVTVKEYMKETYGMILKQPTMPAFNCGTRQMPLWYPAEVLRILPYQIFKGKVPDSLTSGMHDVACHHPADTRALIEHEGLRMLCPTAATGFTPSLACPVILIDPRMLKIPAAVLPVPNVTYGGNKQAMVREGKWNLAEQKFRRTGTTVPFKIFLIVVPESVNGLQGAANAVATGFAQALRTYAMGAHTVIGAKECPNFSTLDIAKKCFDLARVKGANFVFLLLEKQSPVAYPIFKDLADRQYGMHSQCAVVKRDKKSNSLLEGGFGDQQWGNLMMKFNLKTGGTNHTNPDMPKILADTLVLGADVTHAGPSALQGTPSIAAIAGSVDAEGGKFLGSMRLQPEKSACEDIQDVKIMVKERIKAWQIANRKLPKNILYYRDGVSDSQYAQVRDRELPQIRAAFEEHAKSQKMATKVKLTAVVVAKRHNVKLLPESDDPNYAKQINGKEKNGNCRPGTLVDTVVTSPYYSDFYLQSHDGIKGTAKSAHYFLLVNEMKLRDTELQEFTHKLCYTYVRSTTGVSYAPPAYYADRLCDRGRCYLRCFLSRQAGPGLFDLHKTNHREFEDALRTTRLATYVPLRTAGGKTEAEKEQEEKDRKTAEEMIKTWTFEEAKKVFYGKSGVAKNPFNDSISQTMFWM